MLQHDTIAFTISLTDISDENGHTLIHITGKNGRRSSVFMPLDHGCEDTPVPSAAGQRRHETETRPVLKSPNHRRYI